MYQKFQKHRDVWSTVWMISNCDQIKSYLMVQSCDDSFDMAHNIM